jgi:hypothetical protein
MYKTLFLLILVSSLLGSSLQASEWREEKSDHFIVHFKNAPSGFAKKTVDRAEEIYRRTTTTLGITRYKSWTWDKRVKIFIYDNAQDYHSHAGYGWSGGIVGADGRTIMTYPSASGFFDSLLPHELGHIIFHDYLGPKAVVPLWLSEGVAMCLEEGGRIGADEEVRDAIARKRFISLKDLSYVTLTGDSDKEFVGLFYAESASIVNFLLTVGETYRFQRLCSFLKDGMRFEWALKKAYMNYQTISDLEREWRKTLGHEEE